MSATTSNPRSRYIPVAETAQLVRAALKAEFPGQKFSVRSKSYAGGASIHVNWSDGPTEPQVQAVTQLYAGATFDGMQDMKIDRTSLLSAEDGAELVSFGADFVLTQRSISPEWRAELEGELAAYAREPYEHSRRYRIGVHDGRLALDSYESEYGSTLVHQMAYGRIRKAPAA